MKLKYVPSKLRGRRMVYQKRWWWPFWTYVRHEPDPNYRPFVRPKAANDNLKPAPRSYKPVSTSRSVRPVAASLAPEPRRDDSGDFLTGVIVGSLLGGGSSSHAASPAASDDNSFSGGGGTFGGAGASGSWDSPSDSSSSSSDSGSFSDSSSSSSSGSD